MLSFSSRNVSVMIYYIDALRAEGTVRRHLLLLILLMIIYMASRRYSRAASFITGASQLLIFHLLATHRNVTPRPCTHFSLLCALYSKYRFVLYLCTYRISPQSFDGRLVLQQLPPFSK